MPSGGPDNLELICQTADKLAKELKVSMGQVNIYVLPQYRHKLFKGCATARLKGALVARHVEQLAGKHCDGCKSSHWECSSGNAIILSCQDSCRQRVSARHHAK